MKLGLGTVGLMLGYIYRTKLFNAILLISQGYSYIIQDTFNHCYYIDLTSRADSKGRTIYSSLNLYVRSRKFEVKNHMTTAFFDNEYFVLPFGFNNSMQYICVCVALINN